MSEGSERAIGDLVFVGVNSQVIALDRYTGEVVWKWKSKKGRGFVSLLLDGDRILAGINGYVYCLDPLFGQVVWSNPLKGFGVGTMSVTSINGATGSAPQEAVLAQQRAAAAAAANPGVP